MSHEEQIQSGSSGSVNPQERRESARKYQMIINGVLESFDSLDDLKTYVESLQD